MKIKILGPGCAKCQQVEKTTKELIKELSIDAGDTLLVCGPPHGQGLLLLKVDAVEQMLSTLGEQLTNFEKLVRDYKSPTVSREKEAD